MTKARLKEIERLVAGSDTPLLFADTSSAGPRFVDMTAMRVGSLTVLGPASSKKEYGTFAWFWHVHCSLCNGYSVVSGKLMRRGTYKSCGCNRTPQRFLNGELAVQAIFRQYRNDAIERELKFTLSRRDFVKLISKSCFFWGAKPRIGKVGLAERDSFAANGIDRLRNDKGYSASNCVPCCTSCNKMKQAYQIESFLERLEMIHSRLK